MSDAQSYRARSEVHPHADGRSAAGADDDGWGPATPVRGTGVAGAGGGGATGGSYADHAHDAGRSHQTRATRSAYPADAPLPAELDPRPLSRARERRREHAGPVERGLPGWAALLVLLVLAAVGGLIDTLSGTQVRGGFNIGIVVASVVAILVVRRSAMFPIVVAPPIVYSVASAAMIYIRSGGLDNRSVIYDAAANWLVYGFPAIAGATASVLIIAGIRMIIRK